MTTYTTTKVNFEELTKKVNRIFKKLDKIGGSYKFEVVRTFVKEVPVYAELKDEIRHEVAYKFLHNMNVECVEYVLEFDHYVVGNYRVGAVVEATTGDNLVYNVDETINFANYATSTIRCDHCKTNHRRAKAIVLVNNENEADQVMVGTACIKDFIGYNVEQFAKYFKEIESIILDNSEPRIFDYETHLYNEALDVEDYLTYCVNIITTKGYYKELKEDALRAMKKNHEVKDTDREAAKKVIEYFTNMDNTDDSFVNNVKLYVTGKAPVTKENGFVAYAYELYKRMIEKEAKDKALAEEKANTKFVGNVGDKITTKVKVIIAGGYNTEYGYTTIYKMTDENNNVYIWKTSTFFEVVKENGHCVPAPECEEITIRATIKDHSEYRGEKQTVLTRVKAMDFVCA